MNIPFFSRKKNTMKNSGVEFIPEKMKPILRCSICTGEQVAGFKDKESGHFTEVKLIRGPRDLEEFKEMYGIDVIEKEY